jgi:hypothetical protein
VEGKLVELAKAFGGAPALTDVPVTVPVPLSSKVRVPITADSKKMAGPFGVKFGLNPSEAESWTQADQPVKA